MERQTVLRAAVSLLVLGACAFLLVSLLTFEKSDLAVYQLPPAKPVHNGGGLVGAHLAAWMLQSIGWVVALVLVLATAWSVLNLLGKGLDQLVTRVFGALLLVACACTFANAGGEATVSLPGYGGTVGVALGDLVVRYFGEAGKWLLGVPLTVVALLMLSMDELMAPPVVAAGRRVGGALRRAFPKRKRRRKAKPKEAAPPAEPAAETATLPSAAPAPEVPETQDVTETAETVEEEPDRDTGRPVSTGYLGGIQQVGRGETTAPAPLADDEAPTEDTDANDIFDPPTGEAPARTETPASYKLPPVSLLEEGSSVDRSVRSEHVQQQIEVLERTLGEFNIGARVVDIDQGPVVTRYELTLDAGTKLSKVTSLSDDLAIATKAPAVRIVAPIPGKSTIGVELPNVDKELVRMRALIDSKQYRDKKFTIPLFLGKDASGQPIVGDLTRMPHLLIAGATGSGKSVCINSIIGSILFTQHPDDVRLILIDPKVVELAAFAQLPHLLTPVVTNMKRAAWIL
ncbi:MAG: DNA translocase FtsK 4TM domain-containing protein, partial [Planctomycetota bacterium]